MSFLFFVFKFLYFKSETVFVLPHFQVEGRQQKQREQPRINRNIDRVQQTHTAAVVQGLEEKRSVSKIAPIMLRYAQKHKRGRHRRDSVHPPGLNKYP